MGFDISMIDQDVDAWSIAKRIAATEEFSKPWLAKAEVERKSLESELREMDS